MFELIKTDKEEMKRQKSAKLSFYYDCWKRQFDKLATEHRKSPNMDLYGSVVYSGIKMLCYLSSLRKFDSTFAQVWDSRSWFAMVDAGIKMLSLLDKETIEKTFPITKTYDGAKYQCKDYYFTKKILDALPSHESIGFEGAENLTWDYQNPLITRLGVMSMCALSEIRQSEGRPPLAKEIMDNIQEENEAKIVAEQEASKPKFTIIKY